MYYVNQPVCGRMILFDEIFFSSWVGATDANIIKVDLLAVAGAFICRNVGQTKIEWFFAGVFWMMWTLSCVNLKFSNGRMFRESTCKIIEGLWRWNWTTLNLPIRQWQSMVGSDDPFLLGFGLFSESEVWVSGSVPRRFAKWCHQNF